MRGCVDERCSLFYFSIELSGMTGRHRYRAMKNKRHLGDNLQASITVAWHQSQQRDRGSVQPLVSMIVDEGEQGGHLYESNSSDPDFRRSRWAPSDVYNGLCHCLPFTDT